MLKCEVCEKAKQTVNRYLGSMGEPKVLCAECRDSFVSSSDNAKGNMELHQVARWNLGCASVSRLGAYADINEKGDIFLIHGLIKVRIHKGFVHIEDHTPDGVTVVIDAENPAGVQEKLRTK